MSAIIHLSSRPAPPITIWVHGSHLTGPIFASLTRKADLIHKTLFVCPPGLHNVLTLKTGSHFQTIAQILSQSDKRWHHPEHCYTFGWPGKVNGDVRKQAAQQLKNDLKKLSYEYQERYNATPPITIITHSHGGNVALNLAATVSEDTASDCPNIDRLILLACPVQKETAHYTQSPYFKHVYSFYSMRDFMQVADPQGIHAVRKKIIKRPRFKKLKKTAARTPFFSQRTFPHAHITQIEVEWSDTAQPWNDHDINMFPAYRKIIRTLTRVGLPQKQRGLGHSEFLLPSFLIQLPTLIHWAEQQRAESEQHIPLKYSISTPTPQTLAGN